MTDRPTPPQDPAEPGSAGPDQPTPPAAPDDTAVLPQGAADGPAGAEGASGSTTTPAGHPAPEAYPASGVPVAASAAPGAPAGPAGPGRARSWWSDTTSTSGGRAGVAVGAVLVSVVLLAGMLLAGGLLVRAVSGGHHDRMAAFDERGPLGSGRGDGPGRSEDAPGQQKKQGRDDRKGDERQDGSPGRGFGPQQLPPGTGQGMAPGQGRGNGMGAGGMGGLGANVLHGEFTALVNGTPTVMVVQTGEVTTYTSGQSLAIRSTDGFTATYSLNGTTAPSRGADRIATGAQVRVVATKEGLKVTRLVVIS